MDGRVIKGPVRSCGKANALTVGWNKF